MQVNAAPSCDSFAAVSCFANGTQIVTPMGLRAVETLGVGDQVWTLDNGAQTLRWVGPRVLPVAIRIAAGALGDGMPEAALVVSPDHHVLITSEFAPAHFGSREVLVAAQDLCGLPGITEVQGQEATHLMCAKHEIVFANGVRAETQFWGDAVARTLGRDVATDIQRLLGHPLAPMTARPVVTHAQALKALRPAAGARPVDTRPNDRVA